MIFASCSDLEGMFALLGCVTFFAIVCFGAHTILRGVATFISSRKG